MYALVLVSLTILAAVCGVRSAPSGAPTCAYHCPPVDAYAYSVGVHYTTNGAIFCSYPDAIGADPMAYYCLYDELTGVLIDDEDEGSCISNAPQLCERKKRFNIVDFIRRRKAAPEPQAQAPSASVPDMMKKRSASYKKRAANVAIVAAA